MKIMQSIPYVILIVCIFVSTIIAMVHNMDFSVFLKRTSVFYLIIFFGSKICIHQIVKAKEMLSNVSKIDMVVSSKEIETGTDINEEDVSFSPLDLEQQKVAVFTKVDENNKS
ncbi:hypothetical protein FQB35_07600 [Crassaminicella thermophila]|uniref:Uncharacterized protein n=1 Tax=Crassaminicella thermophila TaxID=2599308 RepID=A0A5C0SGZ4_CRATE|nr:hypothetical protein [Crassaminicella thermophila]QEK12249.1 hypothetical protein FQB35_07600 [Crassaminicella thermophila]